MIWLLENEASFRGEGCTVPPKPRDTGRLPNNKMSFYRFGGKSICGQRQHISLSLADYLTSDLSFLPPYNTALTPVTQPHPTTSYPPPTTCHTRPQTRPHTQIPHFHAGETITRTDLPRQRWVKKFQPQQRWRMLALYTHGPRRQTSTRSGDTGGGSDFTCPCQWGGEETLASTFFFNSADSPSL